jgi:hypothetical protein
MATLVFPRNLQKVEYNATTAEGPCRVTVVNGTMDVNLQAIAPAAGGGTTERGSFKALLDPALTPGQFRRAVGTASLATIWQNHNAAITSPVQFQWFIDDVQASFDDEAGQVQLVVDARVVATGNGVITTIISISFQVITLAKA